MESVLRMKSQIIREYFKAWIAQSDEVIKKNFDKDAVYSECYGPIYRNRREILAWFNDWNKKGKVLNWDIKRIITIENLAVVEWYFKCCYKNKDSEFNGVSLIEFNNLNKIISVKEFESDCKHYYPYDFH